MPATVSAAPLSGAALGALRNLASKRTGQAVGWIAIGGARELTLLGYAIRNQSGWQITSSGVDALAATPAAPAGEASVISFHPR
jgi:hypothetical protein